MEFITGCRLLQAMQDCFPIEPNCRVGPEMEMAIGGSAVKLNPLTTMP
jgi:hypothetical protein